MYKERVILEALRHQYVVSFAGFYGEFRGKLLVGIEESALKKTDLIPYIDKVTISKFEEGIPLFLKKHFTVVPVKEDLCSIEESILQQELGIAVLPEDAAMCEHLNIGDRIILNAVLSKKFLMHGKGSMEVWAGDLLRGYVKRRTGV